MVTYQELLAKRRSTRDFADRKVDLTILKEILQDTCIAPSAMNKQPWRFVVIRDQEVMKRISDESKKNKLVELRQQPEGAAKYIEWLSDPNFNVFYNAPSLIMICGPKSSDFLIQDCTLAAAYLMFAAVERNLGTCWIAFGDNVQDKALRQEIGLTDELEIVAPIIIGYPNNTPPMPKRPEPVVLKTIG